jgi:hypothetical protein
MHKVDAVLVPKSMLKYLEDFSIRKENKTAKGKGKGKNATVAEALKAGNATSNGTRKSAAAGDAKSKEVYLNGSSAGGNATAAGKARSAGRTADVAFAVFAGLPLVLASLLVL